MTDFCFTDAHRRHVNEVMNGCQVSPGKKVTEFESRFAKLHDVKHAVMVNSGTDALRLALLALKEANGWQDGDEVLVPALTFVATVNTVFQAGLTPVLVDVGMYDFAINAERLLPSYIKWYGVDHSADSFYPKEGKIRAIVVVHIGGQMADMDPIMRLAKLHKLKVIEDSCETMFAEYKGKSCGSFGDISCFSTYAAHIITTGAGGLACTSDDNLALLMRSYANHGRNTDYLPPVVREPGEKTSEAVITNRFRFDRIGYSCRSTELDAAVGCGELDHYAQAVAKRRNNARLLSTLMADHYDWLELPVELHDRSHSFMFYPLVIKHQSGINKRDLVLFLEDRGIETRDLLPILGQPCYGNMFYAPNYPMADYFRKNAFYVPCHAGLSAEDIEYIAATFAEFATVRRGVLTND
jgi:perosamine synthetase